MQGKPSRFFGPTALIAAVALGTAAPVWGEVKDGVDAWSRGDYATAVREWRTPAAKGDADAQFNLGQAYRLGRGVKRDLARAEDLYGQAASRGHIKAADNYGLLLFQRGERSRALPYVEAAAERGDARAQYVLGLAYFNGDAVTPDWPRAYALVSLAQQAGLPPAAGALSEMDKHIPLDQRQQGAALAVDLAARADAARERQLAAADLGVTGPGPVPSTTRSAPLKPFTEREPAIATPDRAITSAIRTAASGSPVESGADYTRTGKPAPSGQTRVPPVAAILESTQAAKPAQPGARPAEPARQIARPAVAATGPWRVQLGAFGVRDNAERLWDRVKSRPELAGRSRMMVPAGRVTKLQAAGFASRADADAACARLKAAGFECLAVLN